MTLKIHNTREYCGYENAMFSTWPFSYFLLPVCLSFSFFMVLASVKSSCRFSTLALATFMRIGSPS